MGGDDGDRTAAARAVTAIAFDAPSHESRVRANPWSLADRNRCACEATMIVDRDINHERLAAHGTCSPMSAHPYFMPFIIVSCIVARFIKRISCAGIIATSAAALIFDIAVRSLEIESVSAFQAGVADIFMLVI